MTGSVETFCSFSLMGRRRTTTWIDAGLVDEEDDDDEDDAKIVMLFKILFYAAILSNLRVPTSFQFELSWTLISFQF